MGSTKKKDPKPKGTHFIVPYIVYPFDCLVVIGLSDKEFEKILKKKGFLEDFKDVNYQMDTTSRQGQCVILEGGQTLIRLKHHPDTPTVMGYLAHEIFHAVEFLMDRIRIKLTDDSDEAFAYMTAYLTTEIYRKLNEKN